MAAVAVVGGLGPWPGGLREPSRAAPTRAGRAANTRVKVRLSGCEEDSSTVTGNRAKRGCSRDERFRAETTLRAGDASRSIPWESGRTSPGGSGALESSEI